MTPPTRLVSELISSFIGVITYTSNLNTSSTIREMISRASPSSSNPLRIVLETDAPFMVPSNLGTTVKAVAGKRVSISHSAMIPWTAEFVAKVAEDVAGKGNDGNGDKGRVSWDVESVLKVGRENAQKMYGI